VDAVVLIFVHDMWVSLPRCSIVICGAILAAAVYKHDSIRVAGKGCLDRSVTPCAACVCMVT
jgi:hypothetical protein